LSRTPRLARRGGNGRYRCISAFRQNQVEGRLSTAKLRAEPRPIDRSVAGFSEVGPGDVVTVTRIDRLAHSTFDLFAIVKRIMDAKAQCRSLAKPWADTAASTGRLMPPDRRGWRNPCA
jgi:Resolvase, N terminal domain